MGPRNDEYAPNEKFKEFLETKAIGFGLDVSALQELKERQANPAKQQLAMTASQLVLVECVKLEKQQEQEMTKIDGWTIYWNALALALLAAFGFLYELTKQKRLIHA